VLQRLHVSGPLTRSTLARRTGLNRSTIGDLIGELVDLGLAEESPGTSKSGPGRPSPVAKAAPGGAIVLAIELSVDSVAVAAVGLGAHVYQQIRVPTPRGPREPGDALEDVVKLALRVLSSLPQGHRLAGIGVAVAGVVRRSDGFVHLAPNLGWFDLPLGPMIAQHVGVEPVMTANEADLGALAEYRRGAGQGVGHLIYVAGEVGIGVGIIQDGRPMLGSAGYAGEAGHMVINPTGRTCRCGNVGCWETEAGEEALARKAGIPDDIVGRPLIEELLRRGGRKETSTREAFDEVGNWLGLGIGNLINIFNPDLVLIGGFYHDLYRLMESAVVRGVERSALDAPSNMATIRSSSLGVDARLIGAAELVLSEVIADPASFPVAEAGSMRPEAEPTGA
jgi:predicted NBD/HSP70 family sugar kinase